MGFSYEDAERVATHVHSVAVASGRPPSEVMNKLYPMIRECTCEITSPCKRVISDGRTVYGSQCDICGHWVAKKKAAFGPDVEFDDYDPDTRKQWCALRQSIWDSIRLLENAQHSSDRQQRAADYNAYLRGPVWRRIRQRVLERDNGLCQGCLINTASEVHHKNYPEVFGEEMLFDLEAVCSSCHRRIHGK